MPEKTTEWVVRTPESPNLPPVPEADRLRSKIRISQTTYPMPSSEDKDFLRRFSMWQGSFPAGSIPEYIVWEYLVIHKHWTNHGEFEYQWPILGGRTRAGGFVADYYIRPGNMVWNVQGLRYHLLYPEDRAQVMLQAAELSGRGYKVLSLWEDDLLERPTFTIEHALQGQESTRHRDQDGILV